MDDQTKKGAKPAHGEGGAAERPEVSDTSRQETGHTGAGQEAIRGMPAGTHDREHQSNYGGGGANGGASGSGKQ